jgi:hypothetical protein
MIKSRESLQNTIANNKNTRNQNKTKINMMEL